MTAKELIKAGRLAEARKVLVEEVKAAPTDAGKRTLLFQVLAFHGEWDKAARHIDLITTQDPSRAVGAGTYLSIINAEKERLKVMKFEGLPSILPEPPAYFGIYSRYLDSLKQQSYQQARELLDEICEARPVTGGTINGSEFAGISETDAFLFCFIEAFVHENYVWIPFEAVRELVIEEPKTGFDLLWMQAAITTWEGLTLNCSLPALYPGTFLHEDDRMKMGRLTDWNTLDGGLARAVGQHVYQVGGEDMALMDIRQAVFKLSGGEE